MMTNRYRSEWLAKAAEALARVGDRPWALFLLLLCVNTVAQPYAGITHDARLYSAQVLNRVEGGSYADDLFFRYGSQDDYSLFSRLAAPLVQLFGLQAAFFGLYLLSKSLLFVGMIRIVQTLVPNRVASTLALIYCMAVGVTYGGQHMLNVQENFVTPRLLAIALVLIGLDLALRGRPILSGLLILLAVGIHPLMSFAGLPIWVGFHLWKYLGVKAFVAATVGAIALAVVVLAVEPLGTRCFGPMDDEWRQSILHASSFNFPSQWALSDWNCLAFQMVILGVAIGKYRSVDAEKAAFLIVLMLVTLAGTVGAILAEQLPYALLFQGQAYRALWMLGFLHLAFVFWLCVEWSQDASLVRQLASCGLLAYLCCVNGIVDEFVLAALLFPVLAVALRGLDAEPIHRAWLVRSIQLSLVLGALLWAAYKSILLLRGYEELLSRHPEYRDLVEVFLLNLGPIVFCAGVCWLLIRIPLQAQGRLGFALTAAGCLGVQTFFFAFPQTDFYLERCTQYRADLRAVHALIHQDRAASQPLPTVYCNLGCLDYVWLDLHSKSYFDWWQAGNYMYRRDMAMEGKRRARLVAPFEIARFRTIEQQLTPGYKEVVARFYQTDFNRPLINTADFARLCQEPSLDYLVLEHHIEGLPAIQAGKLYLYSCKDVRTALRLPEGAVSRRVASRER